MPRFKSSLLLLLLLKDYNKRFPFQTLQLHTLTLLLLFAVFSASSADADIVGDLRELELLLQQEGRPQIQTVRRKKENKGILGASMCNLYWVGPKAKMTLQ